MIETDSPGPIGVHWSGNIIRVHALCSFMFIFLLYENVKSKKYVTRYFKKQINEKMTWQYQKRRARIRNVSVALRRGEVRGQRQSR